MTHEPIQDTNPEALLDRAAQAVRDEQVAPEVISQAAQRAWTAVVEEVPEVRRIEGCDDYQALLPVYLAGRLPEARMLLVERHTRECVACRKALTARRTRDAASGRTETPEAPRRRLAEAPLWLPLAAGLVLAALGLAFLFRADLPWGTRPVMAEVHAVDGMLLKVTEGGAMAAWAPGEPVREGERLRTAKGSGAVVRLADGSLVEMSERAELALDQGWRGTTVQLDRGRVLVEAAEQHGGKLYVATDDCLVSVKGTVFSVNHGLKGSRVAVLEGEVHVDRQSGKAVLLPGDQVTTSASLARVPLEEEIAWSRDAERWQALLAELHLLGRELEERLPRHDLRFASALLPLVPADTTGYVALPNLGETVGETWEVIQERVGTSDVLAEWWQEAVVSQGMEPEIESLVTRVRDLGSFLGDEVVLAIPAEGLGEDVPVVLAEVTSGALDDFLVQEAERLRQKHGHHALVLVDDLSALPAGGTGDAFYVWTDGGYLVASPDPARLAATAAAALGTAPSGFPGTAFHDRLAQTYRDGVHWLLAADVSRLAGEMEDADLEATGFGDLQHVVIERHRAEEITSTRALLAFDGPRRGVASWLAQAAPMGTLDYVSAQAPLVAAFVVRDPASLLEELAGTLPEGDLTTVFTELEAELGVDLRRDVIASLGGEVAVAIDGPVLPTPSWKLIVEVYDPARLQSALELLVARAAEEAGDDATVALTQGEVRGRTAYTLTVAGESGGQIEVSYLFTDGYLIAAPSTALLDRTLQMAAAGISITTSETFRSLLPDNGETHVSALVFQDLGSVLGEGSGLPSAGHQEGDPDLATFLAAARETPPMLGWAYGREDSIELAASTGGGLFGFGLWGMLTGAMEEAGAAP